MDCAKRSRLRTLPLNANLLRWTVLAIMVTRASSGEPPTILSFQANGALTWTNNEANGIAIFQKSTDLKAGGWFPFYYDLATNALTTTWLPQSPELAAFFRIAVQTNKPDPNLVLYLPFDNDFSNGMIVDVSGYGNHGLRFCLTNWPFATAGPDGSQAAGLFGGRPSTYRPFNEGEYVAVLCSPELAHLSNGTILVWAHYSSNSYGASAILDAAAPIVNSWTLSRQYEPTTTFTIGTPGNGAFEAVRYPDTAPNFDTGGWHYYGVTWDGTSFVGYFDGLPFSTNSQAGIPELVVQDVQGTPWIAIGCWTHGGSPIWADADGLPNNGWFGGQIDDVRIYTRALSPTEVFTLYGRFDKVPPSVPTNLRLRIASSTQVELRWDASTDNRRVEGYRITRNGASVAILPNTCYVDTGLMPQSSYAYAVSAYDIGGNFSGESARTNVAPPAAGAPVDVMVDDADGPPWVTIVGAWDFGNGFPGYVENGVMSDQDEGKGTKSVIYTPNLPEPGDYSVYARYPDVSSLYYWYCNNVPIDIVYPGGTNTVSLNQQVNGGLWNSLGTFTFAAGTNGHVRIRTDGTSGYVLADAFRFVK